MHMGMCVTPVEFRHSQGVFCFELPCKVFCLTICNSEKSASKMTVESIEETEVATSEQAEGSETPEEGNLTMAELASNLMKARSEEEQPESPEEETEPSDPAEESEEPEETQSTEEPEESSNPSPTIRSPFF